MFLFLIGSLLKDVGNLHKTVLFCLGGKVGVAVARLGFAGKGGEDVFFSL